MDCVWRKRDIAIIDDLSNQVEFVYFQLLQDLLATVVTAVANRYVASPPQDSSRNPFHHFYNKKLIVENIGVV